MYNRQKDVCLHIPNTYCILASYFLQMHAQKHNFCTKCNIKSWAYVFNTTLTKILSIDAHTSLDGWRPVKMCFAEKCHTHSSEVLKKIKEGM